MTPLRIVFMGTPDFAVPALRALQSAGHYIVAVYSQPPKPAGRGHQVQETPIHKTALSLGLTVHTPKSLRGADEQKKLAALKPDVVVVAAYGLILPQDVLNIPRMGCLNIHASLLPRWRGAAPIQRALLAGDTQIGITIMQMASGLDTGDMLLKEALPITSVSTAASLHDALAEMGARLILSALEGLQTGSIKPVQQNEAEAIYAAKLSREEGMIDWNSPATSIERQVRALTPWPGTFFSFGGETIKVLQAEVVDDRSSPAGTLIDDNFTIACGKQALRLLVVQRAGKKAADAPSVLRGLHITLGESLL